MRKMTPSDVSCIVRLVRNWKGRSITWEGLRAKIGESLVLEGPVWSRQALQANEDIRVAWRIRRESVKSGHLRSNASGVDVSDLLESALAANRELQIKYDNLALRHRQLIYNAVLLPGGAHLLVDPLPDNTNEQSTHR